MPAPKYTVCSTFEVWKVFFQLCKWADVRRARKASSRETCQICCFLVYWKRLFQYLQEINIFISSYLLLFFISHCYLYGHLLLLKFKFKGTPKTVSRGTGSLFCGACEVNLELNCYAELQVSVRMAEHLFICQPWALRWIKTFFEVALLRRTIAKAICL